MAPSRQGVKFYERRLFVFVDTGLAILVSEDGKKNANNKWLPLSQVECDDGERDGDHAGAWVTVTMPYWLAEEKDLIDDDA